MVCCAVVFLVRHRKKSEGEPLFEARIPAVAFLAIPSYLLCEIRDNSPGLSRQQLSQIVNVSLLKDQCRGLSEILQDMLVFSADQFGHVKHVGFPGKVSDLVQLVKVLVAKEYYCGTSTSPYIETWIQVYIKENICQ